MWETTPDDFWSLKKNEYLLTSSSSNRLTECVSVTSVETRKEVSASQLTPRRISESEIELTVVGIPDAFRYSNVVWHGHMYARIFFVGDGAKLSQLRTVLTLVANFYRNVPRAFFKHDFLGCPLTVKIG